MNKKIAIVSAVFIAMLSQLAFCAPNKTNVDKEKQLKTSIKLKDIGTLDLQKDPNNPSEPAQLVLHKKVGNITIVADTYEGLEPYELLQCDFNHDKILEFVAVLRYPESPNVVPYVYSFTDSLSSLGNTLKTAVADLGDTKENAKNVIKEASDRLRNAIVWIGKKWDKNEWKNGKNKCEDLTAYEISQLRSYYWNDWDCDMKNFQWDFADPIKEWRAMVEVWNRSMTTLQWYAQELKEPVKSTVSGIRSAKQWIKDKGIKEYLKDVRKTNSEKKAQYHKSFWNETSLNPTFSTTMLSDFEIGFSDIMSDYQLSEINAATVDLTAQLIKIRALLDQVSEISAVMWNDSEWTQWWLRKVEKYQCGG